MKLEKSNYIDMNKKDLEKLNKSELIELLLNQQQKPIPAPRTSKSVKDMVQQYEDNIIQPPSEFRDDHKPIPAPRTKKPLQTPIPAPRTSKSVKDMVQQYEDNIIKPPSEFRDDHKPIPAPRTKKPIPAPRTIISQVEKALRGYTKSFDIQLRDEKDPLIQSQKSRKAINHLFKNLLIQTKGFKFVETLQIKFVKYSNDKKISKNGYFNSTTDSIINETDIKLSLSSISTTNIK